MSIRLPAQFGIAFNSKIEAVRQNRNWGSRDCNEQCGKGDGMNSEQEDILSLWSQLPGGHEVIEWFGAVPDFHDAEIVSLTLDRGGPSRLSIYFFRLQQSPMFKANVMEPTNDVIITFEFDNIVDLSLEGFGSQNVIYGLTLGRAAPDPDRAPYFAIDSSPDDYQIELEPCFGLAGKIRARSVRLSLALGKPEPPRPTTRR